MTSILWIVVVFVVSAWLLTLAWRTLQLGANLALIPVMWLAEEYPLIGVPVILGIIWAWWTFFFGGGF